MSTRKRPQRRAKSVVRTVPTIIYVYVAHDRHALHAPYNNSIGGPNDYAYGM